MKMNEKSLSREAIVELITRRRRQILVHSVIYYRWNDSVIDDHTFDRWSKELAELQQQYPDFAAECEWHEGFKNFDGSSGFDLPLHDPQAVNMAHRLLNAVKSIKGNQ
jgi:hypothetical protein